MRKTQVMGAAALVLVLGTGAAKCAFASDGVSGQSTGGGAVTKSEAMDVAGAEASANSVASKYPGLDKYLAGLAGGYDENSSNPGYMAALSEATEAAKLLKGVNGNDSVAERSGEVAVISEAVNAGRSVTARNYSTDTAMAVAEVVSQPEAAKQPEQVATNIAVTVEEKPVAVAQSSVEAVRGDSDDEPAAVDGAKSDETAEESEAADDVELPHTGTERKLGIGEMILVSAAVVVATVGATLVVLHSRKK